jgi:predicted GH43/DUF377 family glycosyl hydrolase
MTKSIRFRKTKFSPARSILLAATMMILIAGSLCARAGVPAEKDLAAYLLVYFLDKDHSLHFALSSDGYSFTDVNHGGPVMKGEDLAEQKGIRDPHIVRGPDHAFYLSMTDLHLFGQKMGFRTTEWQRDASKYDWGNNRALVLMKSTNLVNWSHTDLRVDRTFPGLEELGCVWAPETIYDPVKGKMMIYFTMRLGHGKTKLYYSYTDDAFTKLETFPQELFKYPRENTQILDGDITKVGDKFHLLYVAQERGGGIKQAISDKINQDYVFDAAKVDPETVGCEAPNIWKRNGENKWVLMYDVFGLHPSNMGFSETTDFKTFNKLGYFNDGVMKATNFSSPKHGAVISLTASEAKELAGHWKLEKY